jgi:Uma2 family endonuclease
MTVHPSPAKLTYADYLKFPRDHKRHEIVAGEHHVSPPPIPYHQVLIMRLGTELQLQIGARGLGLVMPAPLGVQLSEHDVVEPDLTVLLKDRQHLMTPKKIKGAPSLVIEVLSPSTRRYDTITKRARYAATGVPEYWIVDADERDVVQLALDGAEYRQQGVWREAIVVHVLPEVTIDLRKVW